MYTHYNKGSGAFGLSEVKALKRYQGLGRRALSGLNPDGSRQRALMVLSLMALALMSWADVVLNHVTIDVVLQADGSAHFTEVWDVDVGQTKFTELYQNRPTRSVAAIKDFTVSDQGKVFSRVNEWDPEASNKEGRCGLDPVNGGYLLCWGIGQPGHHSYKLTYTISNILRPYGTDCVVFNSVLFRGSNLLPHSVTATISRADSVLTKADVKHFEYSEDNTEADFEDGIFTLNTEDPMVEDDFLGVHIEFPITAFGEVEILGTNTQISAEELSSPMMTDANVGKYEESLSDKFWDFYNEWPLLTLFGILGGLIGLFYVVRKIAIALA